MGVPPHSYVTGHLAGAAPCPVLTRCGYTAARQLLDSCKRHTFVQLHDHALIRMFYNTGGRPCEIGGLLVTGAEPGHRRAR